MYSKRGCIVTFGDVRCEICFNCEGWFAVNVDAGESSGYYGSESGLFDAIEGGVAVFE